MVKLKTPICEFGWKAKDFFLKGTDGKRWSLKDCQGPKGTLVMFICNHCPYVQAILPRLVEDVKTLQGLGVGCVGINANDPTQYQEDNFEHMQKIADEWEFSFPYLVDETQEVAKAYGAVCTPDFFGFNAKLELQYRGRLNSSHLQPCSETAKRELVEAMQVIVKSGRGPKVQNPSMGCSIKWRA